MQLAAEDAGCGLRSYGIGRKYRGAGETELIKLLKLLFQILLRLSELRTVCLVEDEDHLFLINRQGLELKIVDTFGELKITSVNGRKVGYGFTYTKSKFRFGQYVGVEISWNIARF